MKEFQAGEGISGELTREERRQADQIRDSIDISDSQMILMYAAGAKQNIADLSASILQSVKNADFERTGDLLSELLETLKETETPGSVLRLPFISLCPRRRARLLLEKTGRLENRVDRIAGKLDEARTDLLRDIGVLDMMYEKNIKYFRKLQIYITAGEEKVKQLTDKTIPELKKKAQAGDNQIEMQKVLDAENAAALLEKTLLGLKTSSMMALQSIPQLRLIQNSENQLADRIQTALQHTIPLWKSRMAVVINSLRGKEAQEEKGKASGSAQVQFRKANAELFHAVQETAQMQIKEVSRREKAKETLAQIEETLRKTGERC